MQAVSDDHQPAMAYWPCPTRLGHNTCMDAQDSQRAYLRTALEAAGVTLKDASLAIGRNQAYIQQYISKGVPQYLREPERDALVRLYRVDGEHLKPPPRLPKPQKSGKAANVERSVDLLQEFQNQELLRVWGRIDPHIKVALLTFLKAIIAAEMPNAA